MPDRRMEQMLVRKSLQACRFSNGNYSILRRMYWPDRLKRTSVGACASTKRGAEPIPCEPRMATDTVYSALRNRRKSHLHRFGVFGRKMTGEFSVRPSQHPRVIAHLASSRDLPNIEPVLVLHALGEVQVRDGLGDRGRTTAPRLQLAHRKLAWRAPKRSHNEQSFPGCRCAKVGRVQDEWTCHVVAVSELCDRSIEHQLRFSLSEAKNILHEEEFRF